MTYNVLTLNPLYKKSACVAEHASCCDMTAEPLVAALQAAMLWPEPEWKERFLLESNMTEEEIAARGTHW